MNVTRRRWGSGDVRGPADDELLVDSTWGYRARSRDDLAEVQIIKVGVRRPKRVLVSFVDDTYEGLREWVPPARLKVRWAEREQFLVWEHRWQVLTSISPDYDAPELLAAESVIDGLIDPSLAETGYNATRGVLIIHDAGGLAARLGVERDWLRSDPLSFDEDGRLIVSWETTLRVAQRAALREPHEILADVEHQEHLARKDSTYGRYHASLKSRRSEYIEPEDCAHADADGLLPMRTLLREWCGQEPNDLHDEIIELRKEVVRVAGLMDKAIDTLRRYDLTRDANRLEKAFRQEGLAKEEASDEWGRVA